MKELPIVREAFIYLAFLFAISSVFFFICKPLIVLCSALMVFIAFFFRNPHREAPPGDNEIVSPADGRVMSVTETVEPVYLQSKAKKISIFLSPLDVHINRSPISGKVEYIHYKPGKFLPAFRSHASELNERNTIGIEGKNVKLLVS